jgi:parallel beta-helix repeat protein
MRRITVLLMLLACGQMLAAQQTAVPKKGLVVSGSTVFRPATYRMRASPSVDSALIVVRGSDITLDLTGVRLVGSPEDDDPDRAAGVAILVDGGSNVTIKGAHIRGYKIAIVARGTRNLRLIDNDLSFNWKPRLYSIVEHESIADWLSYHQNEKDEWLRFGAAIYLSGVRGGEIRGNTVHQGMNGLLMTGCDSLLVYNNDFSFNSGLGIGMYRSDHNHIMHNRVDFNVRGYSHGFYRRGQDSAGILIYQQSDSNVVAFNSVTHGGDGLFIWAGQHTMDTGAGGVNDNLIFQNDFSFAPTNGMEATFSRNVFVRNTVRGSDYGLWGGYSYSSLVLANRFEGNRVGIAIEHGQDNRILGNRFERDSTAIYLWANRIEPSDWGYPKHRDTRSRDYDIRWNTITGARVGIRVSETTGLEVRDNIVRAETLVVSRDSTPLRIDGTALIADSSLNALIRLYTVAPLADGRIPPPHDYSPRQRDDQRSAIVVDEWGPYDWKSPKLWPVDSSLSTPLKLRVLGPAGEGPWRLASARGASISKSRGWWGDTIVVTPVAGRIEDWTVTLEYEGTKTRSPRGINRSVSESYLFSYSRFDPKTTWDVRVYAWNDSTHPVKAGKTFDALLRGERGAPALRLSAARVAYVWYRPKVQSWPQDRAGVVATTEVNLPQGSYAVRTISDDGIRVYVDDSLVIDDWTVHESRVHEAPLSAGKHRIRVEYFQVDGWTELQAQIIKRPEI